MTILCAFLVCTGRPPARAGETADASDKSLSELKALDLGELLQLQIPTVYGASKHEQKITEAPSSVSIITRDDIRKLGYRTLSDILQGVRGFYVTSDRNYGHIGVRGINRPGDWGGRVLIAIDGHRLNEPLYDSAFNQGDFILDVDLIERVEVIRGPGSALYGNNAFFGVLNVVTRRGADLKGTEVAGSYGSFDSAQGRVSFGNRFQSGLDLLLSGTYFDSQGHDRLFFPEHQAVHGGVAERADADGFKSAFLNARYRDFSLQGAWVDREKQVPSAPLGSVFNDDRYVTFDERAYLDFRYQHEFGNELSILARACYDYYRFDGTYPFDYQDPLVPGITLNHDFGRAHWAGAELQLGRTFFEKHRLTGGVEYRRDLALTQKNYDATPPATYLDVSRSGDILGVYLQDEYTILTNLVLNAGVRYDCFSTFGSTINPRGGLIYSPLAKSTFKLLFGQAYRAPNEYENSFVGTGFKQAGQLDPETIRSYELVYEQGLPANLRLTLAGFFNQIEDLIVQDVDPADGAFFYRNLDAVDARGLEAELEGRWAHGLRTRASYTFQESTDRRTGEFLSNSPKHLGKFQLIVPVWEEKIFSSLEVLAMSHRFTARRQNAGGFWIANATLFSQEWLLPGLTLSASVYNLFDAHYGDPVAPDFAQEAVPQDGRTFRVKLTYRF